MPRYQTASQRASGANSAFSAGPNGCVSPGASNAAAFRPPSGLATPAATTATTHTSTRLARNAAAVSSSAARARGVSIACGRMIAASFWTDHRNLITAVATLLVAFLVAQLIDRAIQHRGARLASVMPG